MKPRPPGHSGNIVAGIRSDGKGLIGPGLDVNTARWGNGPTRSGRGGDGVGFEVEGCGNTHIRIHGHLTGGRGPGTGTRPAAEYRVGIRHGRQGDRGAGRKAGSRRIDGNTAAARPGIANRKGIR